MSNVIEFPEPEPAIERYDDDDNLRHAEQPMSSRGAP
jgi:hypothetical protein